MNHASVDIKDMLAAESTLALAGGTDLFIGQEPKTPDDCVTIYDTPSMPPDLQLDGSARYYYSSVQIRIRNLDYVLGITLARNIMETLHGRAGETWGGALYTVIMATGEPALMARDDNERLIFTINFNMQRR